jgi:hypothetical protein
LIKPKCSTCKFLKGEKWEEEDCAKCLPMLIEENQDAAHIYFLVQNQLIMGPQYPIGINQLAVHEAMKLYRIRDRKECFEKVLRLSAYFIEKMRLTSENR